MKLMTFGDMYVLRNPKFKAGISFTVFVAFLFSFSSSSASKHLQIVEENVITEIYEAAMINGELLPYRLDPDLTDIPCSFSNEEIITEITSIRQEFNRDGFTELTVYANCHCSDDIDTIFPTSNTVRGSYEFSGDDLIVRFETKEMIISITEFSSSTIRMRIADPVIEEVTLDVTMTKSIFSI